MDVNALAAWEGALIEAENLRAIGFVSGLVGAVALIGAAAARENSGEISGLLLAAAIAAFIITWIFRSAANKKIRGNSENTLAKILTARMI